jgi:hypothetical protein
MARAMDTVIEALRLQGKTCEALGSPFSGGVLSIIADDVAAQGPFAKVMRRWGAAAFAAVIDDAAPLRILGGLHFLVLTGAAPELAAQYPDAHPEPDLPMLRRALAAAAAAHAPALAEFITSPPQTNEVRRALGLFGGFLLVAGATGLPLRCLEIGASAGLNLNWDGFRYDLGPRGAWGDPGSPVMLNGDWTGGTPPLGASARVVARAGCDRAPVDLADAGARLRLQAYVWADQRDRLARLRAAIALAQATGVEVERADAGAWVEANLRVESGVATVLYHSVVWQYLGQETRARIEGALAREAARAHAKAPLAWLRMEPIQRAPTVKMEVRLTLWPTGESRRIAELHAHGPPVHWLG